MTYEEEMLQDLDALIENNKRLLEMYPDSSSLKISLKGLLAHREELLAAIDKNKRLKKT